MIDEVVVEPFDLAQLPLAAKAQPLGDGAAFQIVDSTADFHPVQIQLGETMGDQRAAAAGHKARALRLGV